MDRTPALQFFMSLSDPIAPNPAMRCTPVLVSVLHSSSPAHFCMHLNLKALLQRHFSHEQRAVGGSDHDHGVCRLKKKYLVGKASLRKLCPASVFV